MISSKLGLTSLTSYEKNEDPISAIMYCARRCLINFYKTPTTNIIMIYLAAATATQCLSCAPMPNSTQCVTTKACPSGEVCIATQ